jgi:Cu(I)-responsive transcriptional regulator
MMNIGDAARATRLTPKTVRYYADIGLVKPMGRTESGYRVYTETELNKLNFVRTAREFGFSVPECRELLGLYENRDRSSREVKKLALRRLREIDAKLEELAALRSELARLADSCRGDDRPDCPILNGIAGKPKSDRRTASRG